MNKPTTLCDRCEKYARCCLNYDGDNCRRSRTVEPTNADRIRAMTDEELENKIFKYCDCSICPNNEKNLEGTCDEDCYSAFLTWLKQEIPDE